MRVRIQQAALVLIALLLSSGAVFASPVLWYNGDLDGVGGVTNERNTGGIDSRIYDDFIVPVGQAWTIDEVFSNNINYNQLPTTAYWEIRSGVSSGNGGSLLFSGTNAATLTPTGRIFSTPEYKVAVTGLNLLLNPGTYWLSVVGIDAPVTDGLITTTSGANAIGLPAGNNANAFWDSAFFGHNFSPTTTVAGRAFHDFSMGVAGTSDRVVPEPASMILLATGLVGLLSRRRGN